MVERFVASRNLDKTELYQKREIMEHVDIPERLLVVFVVVAFENMAT